MINTPPVGELLLIKSDLLTYASSIVFQKGHTAIFIWSQFLGNLGEVFPILDPDKIENKLGVYGWKFIYNGEFVNLNWYETLPTPTGPVVSKWEKYFVVIPKQEYRNYALQKS